jgi:hypothetical protein
VFANERWLLENNMISETTADTLLGYAYMMPGVEQANLALNMEEIVQGKDPHFTYQIKLNKRFARRYRKINVRAQRERDGKGGLWNKLMILWMLKRGYPQPFYIHDAIKVLTSNLLPDHHKVDVNVE